MTARQLHRVGQLLPPDSPYFQLGFRDQPEKLSSSSVAQRVHLALSDPAIGWNVTETYATTGLPLPELDWPPAVLRADAFLRGRTSSDLNVGLAHQLNVPENKAQRDLLRPLLLCRDTTLEQLADRCRLSLDTLTLFEALFWNCRDRSKERLYLAQLCQQPGFCRVAEEHPAEDRGRELLGIAYRTGSADLVLAAAGVAPPPCRSSPLEVLYPQILNDILITAAAGLKTGAVSKLENPLLELVLRFLAAGQDDRTTKAPLVEGLTPEEAVRLSLDGIWQPERREAAARGAAQSDAPAAQSSPAGDPANLAAPAPPEVG